MAKIASHAAYEALWHARWPAGASPVPGRGETVGRGGHPQASVAVRGAAVRVRLFVELAYPVDIGAVCAALRRGVADRVESLTGMTVTEVVVTVERLHSAAAAELATRRVL